MEEFKTRLDKHTADEAAMSKALDAYSTELGALGNRLPNSEQSQRLQNLQRAFLNAKTVWEKGFSLFKPEDVLCKMKSTNGWGQVQVEMQNRWRD